MSDHHLSPQQRRRRLIGQLRRSDLPGADPLASVLDGCTLRRPCRNGACPICGTAFQKDVVDLVDDLIRGPARSIRNRVEATTIVPQAGCVTLNSLTALTFRKVAAELLAAYAELRLPPSIIGVEASFNEDLTGRDADHWSVHAHDVHQDWLSKTQRAELRALFPNHGTVAKAVKFDPLDASPRGSQYPFKSERVRRQTYLDTHHPHRTPYRDTRPKTLRPHQAVRLALVDHQVGFAGRVLTHGTNEDLIRERLGAWNWARDGP